MSDDPFAVLQARADLYARVFNTEDGRAVMMDLKQAFNYDESIFSFVVRDGTAQQLDVSFSLVRAAKRECFDYIARLCGLTYEDIVAMKFFAHQENDSDV